jgi:type VI secretion system protein ImpL
MGIFRKIIKWTLFILGALFLDFIITVILDIPFWLSFILFFFLLGLIVLTNYYIRKKIYQRRTGFVDASHAVKNEQNDLLATYAQVLHTVSQGHNKAALKRFVDQAWLLYFEFDNDNLTRILSEHEILAADLEAPPTESAAHWYWINNLTLIKPNRYITDTSNFDERWVHFLETVKLKHPRAPFNKIVISLSVKALLNTDKLALQKYLESVRRRMVQIVDITGFQIPVVVILSDLDMLSSYPEFVATLSESDKKQAFGIYNRGEAPDFGFDVVDRLANTLDDFIDRISFERKNVNPFPTYQFTKQLRELQDSWRNINQVLFDENVQNPLFSGLFLIGTELDTDAAKNQSIFTKDLFSIVLEKQNLLPLVTAAEQHKNQKIYQVKLAVAYSVLLLVVIYVIYSFAATSRNLIGLLKALPTNIHYTESFEKNLIAMTEYNNLMREIVAFKKHWTIRIFPFDAGLDKVEKQYSREFVSQFRQSITVTLDNYLLTFLREHYKHLTSLQRAYVIQNLVARINIIQAKLNNQSYDYIQKLSAPELDNLGFSKLINFQNFGDLYRSYIVWEKNLAALNTEKGMLIDRLLQFKLLTGEQDTMHWLVDWANTQHDLLPITLSDFWHGSKSLDSIRVQSAYTHEGSLAINNLIAEVNHAIPSYINLKYHEQMFAQWYQEQQLNDWYEFALHFNKGTQSLEYKSQWDYFYNPSVILSVDGPYYHLLDIIYNEFAHVELKNPPIWLLQLKEFYNLLDYQVKKNNLGTARNVSVVTRSFLKTIAAKPSTIKNRSAIGSTYRQNFDNQLKAAQAFLDYQHNMDQVYNQAPESQGKLFLVAKSIYESNSGKVDAKAQALFQAYDNYNAIRALLSNAQEDASAFWLLLRGPFDYYIDYVNRFGSCYLQQKWTTEVLSPTSGLSGSELTNTLFGKNGIAWKFINQNAEAFLTIDANLYVPQLIFGHIFPFNDDFYSFFNSGLTIQAIEREQTQFENYFNQNGGRLLTINSNPTNVNNDAKLLPYKTVLTSVCNKQTVEVQNFNFPASQNINWSLGECGPAQLNIYFNGVTLTKDYPGKFGFAKFLRDYSTGPQTYSVSDFPEQQKVLQAYNVKKITINYQISGVADIAYKLEQFFKVYDQLLGNQKRYSSTSAIPGNITLCWKNSMLNKIYNQEESDIKVMLHDSSSVPKHTQANKE